MRLPGLFGTGSTSIRATQDLQIISGLPPLVREGDQLPCPDHAAQHHQGGHEGGSGAACHAAELKPQQVDIPAGRSA